MALTEVPESTVVRVITRLDEMYREVRDAARVIGDAELFKKMEEAQVKIKVDSKSTKHACLILGAYTQVIIVCCKLVFLGHLLIKPLATPHAIVFLKTQAKDEGSILKIWRFALRPTLYATWKH